MRIVRVPAEGNEHAGLDDVLARAKDPRATWGRLARKAVGLGAPLFAVLRDAERARARAEARENKEADKPLVADVVIADESADGAALLGEVTAALRRFVILPDGGEAALALWALAAHAIDAFDVFPLLGLVSPVKRCGKTTLLTVLAHLLPRPLPASDISPAAVFRTIQAVRPCLLIDEADTFAAGNDELRGVLNSGHTKATAFVIRVEGEGEQRRPVPFSTWAPKVVAQIGKMPETWADRAIIVTMRRRMGGEAVARARRKARAPLRDLCRQAGRWARDHADDLAGADPQIPEGLDDRAQDNWTPLIAVGDLCGGPWPERARWAAVVLSGWRDADDDGAGVRLLRNIDEVFAACDAARISSADLVAALTDEAEWGWGTWRKGRPLDQSGLARLLGPFGVRHRKLRIGVQTVWGYERASLADSWARYTASEWNTWNADRNASPDGHIQCSSPDGRGGNVPGAEAGVSAHEQRVVPDLPVTEPVSGWGGTSADDDEAVL